MKNKLAIIIPAYKACFFREVLDSIVRQSNRDFTVYIGDDASPDDLESIVSDYKDKLDIFYFRFEQNWGGRDLVAHWERCIELSDEPLVWLFSDDDLNWVKIVKCLRSGGTDNKSIKRYIDLCIAGDSTIKERYGIIQNTKEKALKQMEEIKKQLELLEYKEKFYQNLIKNNLKDSSNPMNSSFAKNEVAC